MGGRGDEGDAADVHIGIFSFFGTIDFDYLFPQFFKTRLNSGLIKCRNELRKPVKNIFLIKQTVSPKGC